MWTEVTRLQYDRSILRYASHLTDREWALIGPALLAREKQGWSRTTDLRPGISRALCFFWWTREVRSC